MAALHRVYGTGSIERDWSIKIISKAKNSIAAPEIGLHKAETNTFHLLFVTAPHKVLSGIEP